jgi:hypothetical protein
MKAPSTMRARRLRPHGPDDTVGIAGRVRSITSVYIACLDARCLGNPCRRWANWLDRQPEQVVEIYDSLPANA